MQPQSNVPQTSPIQPGYQNGSHGPPTWPMSLFSSPDLKADDAQLRSSLRHLEVAVEDLRYQLTVEKKSRATADDGLESATGTNHTDIAALQKEVEALRLAQESDSKLADRLVVLEEQLQLLDERLGHGLRDVATKDMVVKEGEAREATFNKQLELISREINTREAQHGSTVNELTALRQQVRDLEHKLETAAKETADKIIAQMREHMHQEKSSREGDINHLRDIVIGPSHAPTSRAEPAHRVSADIRCSSFRSAELGTKVAHAKRSLKGSNTSRDLNLDGVDAHGEAKTSPDLEKKLAAFEAHMRTDTGISAADRMGVLERVSRLEMLIHREEDARERQVQFVEGSVVKKLQETQEAFETAEKALIAAIGDETLAREVHHVEMKGMFNDMDSKHAAAHDSVHGMMRNLQGQHDAAHAALHEKMSDMDSKHRALHANMSEMDSKHGAAHDSVHEMMRDLRGQHDAAHASLHEMLSGGNEHAMSLTEQLQKVEAFLEQEITNRESDVNGLTMYFWAQPLANKCSSIRDFAATGGPDIVGQVGALDTAVQDIQKRLADDTGRLDAVEEGVWGLDQKHTGHRSDDSSRHEAHLVNHHALAERVTALENAAPSLNAGQDPALVSKVLDLQRQLDDEAHARELNVQALEQQVDDSKLHTDEVAVHFDSKLNDLRDMLDNHSHEFDAPEIAADAGSPAPVPATKPPVRYVSMPQQVAASPMVLQRSLPIMSAQHSVPLPMAQSATLPSPVAYPMNPAPSVRSIQISQATPSPRSYAETQPLPLASPKRSSTASQHITTGGPKYAPGHAH